jgi:hypothetical protein
MANLKGLIGYRLDMSDGAFFACPILGNEWDFRAKRITELGIYLDRHPSGSRIYLEYLEIF